MILLTIAITLFGGMAVMAHARAERRFNLGEWIALAFAAGLSIAVITLFVSALAIEKFMVSIPVIVIAVLTAMALPRILKLPRYAKLALKRGLNSFAKLPRSHRILVGMVIAYALVKIVLAFDMTISHVTRAEDAVLWWEMKTKIFFENRSLALDLPRDSPEFFGGSLIRNPFAPLADFWFICAYTDWQPLLSNMLSPLVFMSTIFFLAGRLAKIDQRAAALRVYLFASLPLVFAHAYTSYFNLPLAFFLLVAAIMIDDALTTKQRARLWPVAIVIVFGALVRNEGALLIAALLATMSFAEIVFCSHRRVAIRRLPGLAPIAVAVAIAFGFNVLVSQLSKTPTLAHGQSGGDFSRMAKGLSILFENPKRLLQPIEQLLFRNEYHFLFLLFVVTLPFHFWRVRTLKPLTAGLLCLMGIFVFVTATADFTLLDTHFGMVRFSIALTPLTAYFIAREVGERISNSCSLPGPDITRH